MVFFRSRMEITGARYARIARHLPVQRGDVGCRNLQVRNAILYVRRRAWLQVTGAAGRRLARFGRADPRMNRWLKNEVLDRVFDRLQGQRIVRLRLEAVLFDGTVVKVHPDGTGALEKRSSVEASPAAAGPPSLIWLSRMSGRS